MRESCDGLLGQGDAEEVSEQLEEREYGRTSGVGTKNSMHEVPDPVLYWGKGSGTWHWSSLSLRNLIRYVIMSLVITFAKQDLQPCCTEFYCVPAHEARYFSLSLLLSQRSRFTRSNFPSIITVACVYCIVTGLLPPWFRQQTALWPCPRPFPSMQNWVWLCETIMSGRDSFTKMYCI